MRPTGSTAPAVTGRSRPFCGRVGTFAGSIEFVNRARVAETLAPGRQMGVHLSGRLGAEAAWTLGGFTGPDNGPANESLLGVARLEVTPHLGPEEAHLSMAAIAAKGRDGAVAGRAIDSAFERDGSILSVDARLRLGGSGELDRPHRRESFPPQAPP